MVKRGHFMFRNINIIKIAVYYLYTAAILVNSALILIDLYTPENRNIALTLFILAIFVLVIVPTYFIAKTGWLKK